MKNDIYTETHIVPQHWCDMENRITAGYILRISQDIATAHCKSKGLDDTIYSATHTAFLLAKSQIIQTRPILWGDTINVVTEAFGPNRATFLRTICFFDESGELLAKVNSLWFLIDTETKRIVRHAPEELLCFFTNQNDEQQQMQICKCDASLILHDSAKFTMCDKNCHVNNTVYADIVFDNLPQNIAKENVFKEMLIVYHNEIPYESEYDIVRGKCENGVFYFCGQNDTKKFFEANIKF